MPFFRGVDMSIIAQSDSKKLPEFPHSEASSVGILPFGRSSTPAESAGTDTDLLRIQKVSPQMSVYVPSVPGAQFGIHYSIKRIPEPPCQLYFKVFMNGRNITNWGMDPAVEPTGSVTRALFEPDDRWHFKENGVLLKREGIEARNFHFLPTSKKVSVADDGGLIEIKVFRAKGRKRKAPFLGQYRSQKLYGIMSSSGGLLDSPEEACYYDWVLIDPKEFPFVSFRFHYRSWTNLCQLNLAPAIGDLNELLQRSDSARRSVNSSTPKDGLGEDERKVLLTKLEKHGEKTKGHSQHGPSFLHPYPPALGLSSLDAEFAGSEVALAIPRPLPEIPVGRPASRKSFESTAPSIAPSLLPYIEEESDEDEEVELGMATQMPIQTDPSRSQARHVSGEQSTASSDKSPSQLSGKYQTHARPSSQLFKTETQTPRTFLSRITQGQTRSEQMESLADMLNLVTTIEHRECTLSEGEWMKRS